METDMANLMIRFSFVTAISILLFSCESNKIPEPLERALQTAEQMASKGMLEQSAFYAIFPEGTPSKFVSFLFSDIGAAERPPVEGSGEINPDEQEMHIRGMMPVWPANVGMTYSNPDTGLGMQVVWKWDDAKRMIILEGYVDPTQPPVAIRKTELPVVQPSEISRLAGKSQQELGGRSQGF
jgi:hypothetical protein